MWATHTHSHRREDALRRVRNCRLDGCLRHERCGRLIGVVETEVTRRSRRAHAGRVFPCLRARLPVGASSLAPVPETGVIHQAVCVYILHHATPSCWRRRTDAAPWWSAPVGMRKVRGGGAHRWVCVRCGVVERTGVWPPGAAQLHSLTDTPTQAVREGGWDARQHARHHVDTDPLPHPRRLA
jgi:hypothetical protein